MKKIIVNITSYKGISIGAIHYYAKFVEFEDKRNIYDIANNNPYFNYYKGEEKEIIREIDTEEAEYLNIKDGAGSRWKAGDKTIRHNSIDEIKKIVLEKFKKEDVIFLIENELTCEDSHVYQRKIEEYQKTGEQIRIHNFMGFSDNFKNLTEGSLHDVIQTPERYKGRKLQKGKWVMGVYEPALVLQHEYQSV